MKDMIGAQPELAAEMFEDALNALLANDLEDGRLLLRQYVNLTIGFTELAARTGKQSKNLMRSLSADGNPTATNLFEIIHACMEAEGMAVAAHVTRPKSPAPSPAA
jgi:DNA-binding phage protein